MRELPFSPFTEENNPGPQKSLQLGAIGELHAGELWACGLLSVESGWQAKRTRGLEPAWNTGGGGPPRGRHRRAQARPVPTVADVTPVFWGGPPPTEGRAPGQAPAPLAKGRRMKSTSPRHPASPCPLPSVSDPDPGCALAPVGFPCGGATQHLIVTCADLFCDRRCRDYPHLTGETIEAQGAGSSETSGSQDSGLGLPPLCPARWRMLRWRRQNQPVPALTQAFLGGEMGLQHGRRPLSARAAW